MSTRPSLLDQANLASSSDKAPLPSANLLKAPCQADVVKVGKDEVRPLVPLAALSSLQGPLQCQSKEGGPSGCHSTT